MMDKNENFKVIATADFYEILQDLDKSEKHLLLGLLLMLDKSR